MHYAHHKITGLCRCIFHQLNSHSKSDLTTALTFPHCLYLPASKTIVSNWSTLLSVVDNCRNMNTDLNYQTVIRQYATRPFPYQQ